MIEARDILIVDNDELFANLMRTKMRMLGLPHIIHTDPARAVEEVQTNRRIGLLWTDLHMPGMSGIEVARIARNERPEMPIILATAGDLEEEEEQALYQAGVDLTVSKFDLSTKAIREFLRLAHINRLASLDLMPKPGYLDSAPGFFESKSI